MSQGEGLGTDHETGQTRRSVLRTGLGLGALWVGTSGPRGAWAEDRKVTEVKGFKTSADVAKAEAEGEVVFYTHDSENAATAILDAFSKDFPKIKGTYFRAQNGALYGKVLAERSAGRFNVDVVQFSEVGTAIEFQKKNGFAQYVSPASAAYADEHLSSPKGYYFWPGVSFGGIAYNSDKVKPEDAPKVWKDLLNPRWRDSISTKQSTSGMQFVEWYELRKLYGDDFWKAFAKQRPRGFDSRVQLFDRLAKGDDKICALAEWAGYSLIKQRGAPVVFVAPPDGLPAAPLAAGVVDKAPHPEAARLLIDWMMSSKGQALYQDNPYLFYGSVRKDAPPMPGGKRLSDFKLLYPKDMSDFLASRKTYITQWDGMLGL